MAFILKDGQKVGLSFSATDADGNEAAVADIAWATSDDTLVTIEVNPEDNTQAVATTVEGPGLGTVTITATADADLGEGVTEIVGVLDIEVVAGDAAIINIEAGTPEDR